MGSKQVGKECSNVIAYLYVQLRAVSQSPRSFFGGTDLQNSFFVDQILDFLKMTLSFRMSSGSNTTHHGQKRNLISRTKLAIRITFPLGDLFESTKLEIQIFKIYF